MGRIKNKLIKRTAKELLQKYGVNFKKTFEENKQIIPKYAKINSKKLRNVIVGYITHLKKTREDY
ncbi:30S ribosomal protein S17e [Candidatus Woesearchaeota archaeon]|nr:30S ribosomal protein S17e [Candidatus Woesearchaeota archaeon]